MSSRPQAEYWHQRHHPGGRGLRLVIEAMQYYCLCSLRVKPAHTHRGTEHRQSLNSKYTQTLNARDPIHGRYGALANWPSMAVHRTCKSLHEKILEQRRRASREEGVQRQACSAALRVALHSCGGEGSEPQMAARHRGRAGWRAGASSGACGGKHQKTKKSSIGSACFLRRILHVHPVFSPCNCHCTD